MSVDTTITETRCNRSLAKNRNDGETTKGEAENAERESRDTCLHEYRGRRRSEGSCVEMSHHGVDDRAAG